MGPDRLLKPLDRLVHRLDRWSGLRARRQRRAGEASDRTAFAYEVGRYVADVAERCGYGDAQISGTNVTFCGDPNEVLARHPWLMEESVDADVPTDQGWCVDLHVEWREGWVELKSDPFVFRSLFVQARDRGELGDALEELANRLQGALDRHEILEGVGRADDPRDSDGSWGYLSS